MRCRDRSSSNRLLHQPSQWFLLHSLLTLLARLKAGLWPAFGGNPTDLRLRSKCLRASWFVLFVHLLTMRFGPVSNRSRRYGNYRMCQRAKYSLHCHLIINISLESTIVAYLFAYSPGCLGNNNSFVLSRDRLQ